MKVAIGAVAGAIFAFLVVGIVFLFIFLFGGDLDARGVGRYLGGAAWAFFGLFAGILVPLVWYLIFAFMGRISR